MTHEIFLSITQSSAQVEYTISRQVAYYLPNNIISTSPLLPIRKDLLLRIIISHWGPVLSLHGMQIFQNKNNRD